MTAPKSHAGADLGHGAVVEKKAAYSALAAQRRGKAMVTIGGAP